MRFRGEEGYILASSVAVLLAISLVAAALVSTSAENLRRVRRAETDASSDAALRSALLLIGSQLSLDPRRRQLDFDVDSLKLDILGRPVDARISWETFKIDVNLASFEAIEEALRNSGVDDNVRNEISASIQQYKGQKKPIALLDDVLPASADQDCVHSVLTVFGGRPDYVPEEEVANTSIGRPAAGTQLSVEVWLADEATHGLAAVIVMTGDPTAPAKVLDLRKMRAGGEERCHAS